MFQKAQVTIQFVRKLLEAGAEIDTLDRKDRTPIMMAAEFHPDPGHEFEIIDASYDHPVTYCGPKVHGPEDWRPVQVAGRWI